MGDFRLFSEANPIGSAINLIWELPDPNIPPDQFIISILRRQGRFPGINRRGAFPIIADAKDLQDGTVIYDSRTFNFDKEEIEEKMEGNHRVLIIRQYQLQGNSQCRILVRIICHEYRTDDNDSSQSPINSKVIFIDRSGLIPGIIYYYTAFIGAVDNNETLIFSRLTQSSSLATGRYGFSIYSLLPRIHQQLDTELPSPSSISIEDANKGQLQRFLEIFEAHLDMLYGLTDDLRNLYNIRNVNSSLLPHLAHLIGWRLKDYLNEEEQRNEIIFAPEVYKTVGTAPNIAAMINRLTGWDTQIKEFACNVLMSFDTTRLDKLESGETVYLDGRRNPETGLPYVKGREAPLGSIDTTDAKAMYKLRIKAFDDQTVYTYDCGTKEKNSGYLKNDNVLYNRETIGIYIIPDVNAETFTPLEEWKRIEQILNDFLPINTRAIFVLQPEVYVEEVYNNNHQIVEDFHDIGILTQGDMYEGVVDEARDQIPGWRWFITNDLRHLTVDVASTPIDTSSRTWHTWLS